MKQFKVGDKVKYKAEFCRSIGAFTGPIPFLRGVVESVEVIAGRQFLQIKWNDGRTVTANACNIE